MSLLITDDETIRSLNRDFRFQDKPTDVLSFPLGEPPTTGPKPPRPKSNRASLGDVAISVDTAVRQSQDARVSLREELQRLAVHGTLHLLGFEDETEEGARRMKLKEDAVLAELKPIHTRRRGERTGA